MADDNDADDDKVAQLKAQGWNVSKDRGMNSTGTFISPPAGNLTVTPKREPMYDHPSSIKAMKSQPK